MQFFGQNGEDRILSRIFRGRRHGVCVEVGAYDGTTFSNTLYFESIGWRVVLVEPNAELCRLIRQRRKARLFECAASSSRGRITLHVGPPGTAEYATVESAGALVERTGIPCSQLSQMEVDCRSLDEIVGEAGLEGSHIDFISIDVEGHELAVLQGFSIDKYRPRLLIVEDNSSFRDSAVRRYLRQLGYVRFLRTGCNDWYARCTDLELVCARRRLIVGVLRLRHRLARMAPRWIRRALRGFGAWVERAGLALAGFGGVEPADVGERKVACD